MSDTPQVDALDFGDQSRFPGPGYGDLWELARNLERENAALRTAVGKAIDYIKSRFQGEGGYYPPIVHQLAALTNPCNKSGSVSEEAKPNCACVEMAAKLGPTWDQRERLRYVFARLEEILPCDDDNRPIEAHARKVVRYVGRLHEAAADLISVYNDDGNVTADEIRELNAAIDALPNAAKQGHDSYPSEPTEAQLQDFCDRVWDAPEDDPVLRLSKRDLRGIYLSALAVEHGTDVSERLHGSVPPSREDYALHSELNKTNSPEKP